ncbi:MAG: SDR family NAD(P)-dependent oxidoreductase [Actinomycetota bacterium]|nr:SDR family NAD(P)-dependent oxidoreductase [Actinomycetota bacterium]
MAHSRTLFGKVALITGGGRGIGAALAGALAAQGARVVVADVDEASAHALAAELGRPAIGIGLDVTDFGAFSAAIEETERRLGPLDILVNNAGIMPLGSFELESDDTVVRQLQLNVHAVIHGSKEAVRRMKPRRRGHIVNVSSSAGRIGFPGGATYSACKFAVAGLSEALRAELRGTGVEVTLVMPGLVHTELAVGVPDARAVRRVTPEEVADAIVDALKRPRFEVYVPAKIGALVTLGAVLPWRVRDLISRVLKADRVLMRADAGARVAYEARAAASAPGARRIQPPRAGLDGGTPSSSLPAAVDLRSGD